MPPTIVVTRKLPADVERQLAERFDARLNASDTPFVAEDLARALREADGVLCTVTDRLDAAVFAAAGTPRARILANFGVGYNHIDVAAASAHDIIVTNTPGVLTEDTADLALALILMTARRLGEGERLVRAGAWTGWTPTQLLGTSLHGKTLGIVGYGRIGRALARRAHHGLGMRVLYASRSQQPDDGIARRADSLETLLAVSDVVSLHVPATSATRQLIGERTLALLQPHAILINTSRGDVIDERALVAALRAGTIAAAGLDVFVDEPHVPDALRMLDNVVLLPHLGSATEETRRAMGERALANLVAFFDGDQPPDRIVRS